MFKKRYTRIAWIVFGSYLLVMIFLFLLSNAISVTKGIDERWLYFIFIMMFYASPIALFYVLVASLVAVLHEFSKRREELNSVYREQEIPAAETGVEQSDDKKDL